MDSSTTNDVESYYHDNNKPEEWQGKVDCIYLIEGHALHKLEISGNNCIPLKKVDLTQFDNIKGYVNENVRDNDFIRISVDDRCLTIKGTTVNYYTGLEWDFMANSGASQSSDLVVMSESIPFSNLQIAFIKDDTKAAFLIKN